tara:strand:- start:45 stop:260 length:216 start_codon:yes stop_codon:yes gene_type:complete
MLKKQKKKKKQLKKYLLFSSLALQMGVIIFLGTYIGNSIDKKEKKQYPVFTIIGSLGAFSLSIYYVFRKNT